MLAGSLRAQTARFPHSWQAASSGFLTTGVASPVRDWGLRLLLEHGICQRHTALV